MTAQKGFEYEKNVATVLKKLGLVHKSFSPAGAGSDQPDLEIFYQKKKAGVELKITAASAGSLVLKYDTKNKRNPWGFTPPKSHEKEKIFITQVAERAKLFEEIKKQWKEIPYKRPKDPLWEATAAKLNPRERYARDFKTFKELKGAIPPTEVEKYYNQKDTHYVNIGTNGFYLLGNKDPLKLNAELKKLNMPLIPVFSKVAKTHYRARVQSKGGGAYQFTFEMSFSVSGKSPYNIGPVKGSSVKIIEQDLNLSCFPKL